MYGSYRLRTFACLSRVDVLSANGFIEVKQNKKNTACEMFAVCLVLNNILTMLY